MFPQFRENMSIPSIMGNDQFQIENGMLPKYNMQHSFSLVANSQLGSTVGVYSNFFNYQISEKFSFSSSLHLMNNQYSGFNNHPLNLSYGLGFTYQLSENSRIQLNMVNLGNTSFQSFASPMRGF